MEVAVATRNEEVIEAPEGASAPPLPRIEGVELAALLEGLLTEVERRPRGVVEKCTFCQHRLDRGLEQGLTPGVDDQATPACVVACPVNARIFGDALDPESPLSQYLQTHDTFRLREDFGTEPKVHYVRPEKGA